MPDEATPEEETKQLEQQIALLKKRLELLKAETDLEREKQRLVLETSKQLTNTRKALIDSEIAHDQSKAQLAFAELQGIKAGMAGLTLPEGKEGTVKVAAGTEGTALLRSKLPMLELLNSVASDLKTICQGQDTALVTEEQLEQAAAAQFTDQWLTKLETRFRAAPKAAAEGVVMMGLPELIAGAYALGMTLKTVNSLSKLLRTDRQIDVFAADEEAKQMLSYLLEAKGDITVANVSNWGDTLVTAAVDFSSRLSALREHVQPKSKAKDGESPESQIQSIAPDNAPAQAAVEEAKSLLDGLDPGKQADSFWEHVKGKALADSIQNKQRLLVEAKAQAMQISDSAVWGDSLSVAGEVQVAYRLLNPNGSVKKSGVILKASGLSQEKVKSLKAIEWKSK